MKPAAIRATTVRPGDLVRAWIDDGWHVCVALRSDRLKTRVLVLGYLTAATVATGSVVPIDGARKARIAKNILARSRYYARTNTRHARQAASLARRLLTERNEQ